MSNRAQVSSHCYALRRGQFDAKNTRDGHVMQATTSHSCPCGHDATYVEPQTGKTRNSVAGGNQQSRKKEESLVDPD